MARIRRARARDDRGSRLRWATEGSASKRKDPSASPCGGGGRSWHSRGGVGAGDTRLPAQPIPVSRSENVRTALHRVLVARRSVPVDGTVEGEGEGEQVGLLPDGGGYSGA